MLSTPRMVSLSTAAAMVCATVVIFFAGVFAAHAWPGRAGEARSSFTVAGSLTLPAGATRPPTMRFVFHKTGAADCSVDTRADMPPTGDQFTAQIDYDACGRTFFDGSDVTADVLVNGAIVVSGQAVNPVPYAHFASTAGVARHYETPDCPVGYDRQIDALFPRESDRRLCQRSRISGSTRVVFDEVVRVGSGASAFWVDRYEAVVMTALDGSGDVLGATGADYGSGFPANGQWTTPLFALSRAAVMPSRFITWFQANAACHASGKRLPTGSEWLEAARRTPDPQEPSAGGGSDCATAAAGPRATGRASEGPSTWGQCVSAWGAEDMIGNAAEWTDDWYASVGQVTSAAQTVTGNSVTGIRVNHEMQPWPSSYGADYASNITATTYSQNVSARDDNVNGLPAAIVRGGAWSNGVGAGVFQVNANFAPTHWNAGLGFRCVIPR